MLIRSEICEDNITKPIHKIKHTCDWKWAQAVNNKYVIVSHLKNEVSCQLEYYGKSVAVLIRVL
jgi:hypothetical protein